MKVIVLDVTSKVCTLKYGMWFGMHPTPTEDVDFKYILQDKGSTEYYRNIVAKIPEVEVNTCIIVNDSTKDVDVFLNGIHHTLHGVGRVCVPITVKVNESEKEFYNKQGIYAIPDMKKVISRQYNSSKTAEARYPT